jgi:hypothetical protein
MLADGKNIGNKRLSAFVQADGILLNIICIFILSNSNRLLFQADKTQNISTAENRLTYAAVFNSFF